MSYLSELVFFLLLSLGFKQRYVEQWQVFSGGRGGTSFLVWPYLSCYIVLGWIFSWAQMLLTQAYKMFPRGNAEVRCFSGCSGIDWGEQCLGASESAGEMEVWVAFSLTYAGSDTPGTGFYARLWHFAAAKISPSWKRFSLTHLQWDLVFLGWGKRRAEELAIGQHH